jgi:hydrogenase maturation factor
VSAPACEPNGHCVTCSDEGIPMRVLELRDDAAVCVDEHGGRHEVAVELVQPLRAGDEVLVHAGVAIR